MSKIPTITLWRDNDSVIVEPESAADKLFRFKGYVEIEKQVARKELEAYQPELPKANMKPVAKRGRPKKVKAGGN